MVISASTRGRHTAFVFDQIKSRAEKESQISQELDQASVKCSRTAAASSSLSKLQMLTQLRGMELKMDQET